MLKSFLRASARSVALQLETSSSASSTSSSRTTFHPKDAASASIAAQHIRQPEAEGLLGLNDSRRWRRNTANAAGKGKEREVIGEFDIKREVLGGSLGQTGAGSGPIAGVEGSTERPVELFDGREEEVAHSLREEVRPAPHEPPISPPIVPSPEPIPSSPSTVALPSVDHQASSPSVQAEKSTPQSGNGADRITKPSEAVSVRPAATAPESIQATISAPSAPASHSKHQDQELEEVAVATKQSPDQSAALPTSCSVDDSLGEADVKADVTELETPQSSVTLRPSVVPSSRIGRMFHYGSLFAGLGLGAASEMVRRSAGGQSSGSVFMSDANVRRLVGKLSQMRGAALKLGQFMSIQDTNMLPEQLEKVLQQVQANADYMPDWQLEKVMRSELGADWESNFASFPRVPMAAASIGQVHRATLAGSNQEVAVKVQFPGIHNSIESDLNNLSLLLRGSAILPRGLYLNNTIAVFRGELADECDYTKEAESQRKMKQFLQADGDNFFEVPKVIDDLSTRQVLTTEIQSGRPLSEIRDLGQPLRDKIGTAILRLCMLELFQFRLMQTDPNWANFLYDRKRDKLGLIDFGATREYSVEFMDKWYQLLSGIVRGDRQAMHASSLDVGYLTGEENEEMIEAHLRSMELLAIPFTQDVYDFSKQSVTDEIRKLVPVMLKHRLTPPPNETYSLNRKLSGSFLLCAKLGSKVECKKIWEEVVGSYKLATSA